MALGRKTQTDRTPERATRIPVSGSRNILVVGNQDPDYVYRWVNDKDGRIARFIEAGYAFVDGDGKEIGDKTVDSASGAGSQLSKDVGGGLTAYYMRIKRTWHKEDQALKQKRVDASEESMKRELNKQGDGNYGNVGFGK